MSPCRKNANKSAATTSRISWRETCRHWSVAPETLLQKTKDNVAQSSLSSREERQKNVVGAYVAVNEDKIKGQRILLIDDILTTGATLREAARVLREAGAERVICATLAAADED
jgi:competence protein ComFC